MSEAKGSVLALPENMKEMPVRQMPAGDVSPLALLQIAVQRGDDIEKLRALKDFCKEMQADQARIAYVAAMARFKSSPTRISKDKAVGYETKEGDFVGYRHASIGNVVASAAEGLSQQGLSHHWDIKQDGAVIKVTCIITHELGHSESVSMSACKDDSGKKNQIQQVASAVTYLQRYTLLAATGLATHDQDDPDGADDEDDPRPPANKKPPPKQPAAKPPYSADDFATNLPGWTKLVTEGKKTPKEILAKLESKATLSNEQHAKISELKDGVA